MKKRRLLALVLCFVMLFSDATSTFASSLPDTPVVITETSDENEENSSEVTNSEITETDVPDDETLGGEGTDTSEILEGTETTETTEIPDTETVTETETVESTEIEETTETEEDTELVESTEVLLEEEKELERLGEGETLTASVFYMNGEESVAIGDGQYATLTAAKTAIETFLNENTDFTGAIHVSLNLHSSFSGDDLALEHDNAWLELHMNGYALSLSADACVRANIDSDDSQAALLLNDNYTLTLLPTSQSSDGMTNTNISNIQIVGNQQDPIGKLIVGECRDSEGTLVNRSIHLNDVPIINLNEIVFQGDMSYYYDGILLARNELRVENAFDDEAGIHQYISIDAEVQGKNVIWNGNGQVTDLKVTDTLTAYADWQMTVRGNLEVNNINVTAGEDTGRAFCITKATILDGDNNNALLSEANVTISGAITENGVMNYPLAIQKKNIIQRVVSDEYGSWIDEKHEDGRAFEVGEVVLTLGENATVNANDIRLEQWENDEQLVLGKENNQLIACELAVEVHAHTWNGEAEEWEHVRTAQYDSFGAAVAGIEEDFSDVSGRFDIILFKDVELTEDVTLSHLVREVNIDSAGMWVEVTDDEGNVIDGYDHRVRRTFTFNGHSLTVQGNVYWRESVQILNGADTSGSIMAEEFNWEWVDAAEHFGLADGTAIDRSEETNVVIDGVNIMAPGGRVEFRVGSANYEYLVNAELLGGRAEFGGAKWTVLRLVLTEENGEGLFIGEEADVTITDKFSARAGNWAEVRGKLTLAKLIVNPHSQDPYANYNIQIVTGYNGNGWDEEPDELSYQGSVIFNGSLIGNGYFANSPIRLEKSEVYRYVAIDEEGNIIWDKEEEGIPCYNEDRFGNLDFASGETVAIVNNPAVDTSIFTAGGSDAIFVLEGKELKAYKAAVRVDAYWEEEDTGAVHNYLTLEDAFANMEKDFGGKPGHYTFNIVDDVKMSKNLTVPSFVTSMRMQADWQWIEHRDENDNPIIIYDEEGNEIGREGHDRTDFATLDMNGFTLTSAAPIEFMEGLQIVSTAVDKNGKVVNGKIIVTAEEGEEQYWATVSFNQASDVELVSGELDENGNLVQVERNEDYTWAFISNVDVYVENGRVNLWSNWCNYVIDGDITAEWLTLRGNWTVDNVTVTTDLCLEEGWYDEENDCGEPEGRLTVENLTIDGGHVYNAGRILVSDTFTVVNGGTVDNQALIIADTFAMETGRFDNWGQVDVKNATIQEFYAHTHIDFSEDDPETPEDETELIGQRGSIFICDTLTQPANGHSWFDRATTLVVNEKAVIYNPVIGGWNWDAWDEVNIHRMPNATIEINGNITREINDVHVSMSVLNPVENAVRFSFAKYVDGDWYDIAYVDENGEIIQDVPDIWAAKVLEKNEVLFTTNAKAFPTEWIHLHQTGENIQYWSAYQNGNEIRVGGNWITIYSMVDSGDQKELARFSLWSEAEAFIAELANPDISYIIEISDDLDVEGKLTFPAKAKAVIITGVKPDGSQVELTYTGDITLNSDVTFGFIKLNAVDAAGKEYHSVVNTKGYTLMLFGVNADFASITGTKGSALVVVGAGLEGQKVTVDGAIKNVEILDMGEGQLEVGAKLAANAVAISGLKTASIHDSLLVASNGSIAVTGDTILSQATIRAKSKITLADVYSLDNQNKIIYAGNSAANILTITGSVYGPGSLDGLNEELLMFEGFDGVTEDNQIVNFDDENIEDRIRCAAIDISVESLARAGYTPGDVLLNAPKVSPKWFVVGSEYNEEGVRTSILSMTHKTGDQICYGAPAADAVTLYTWNDTVGNYLGYDSYPTLQAAFDAIEKIGDVNGNYYIIMSEDMDVENVPATLKTPKKAAIVAIDSENEAVKLYYKNELQINSMVVLNNVILAPQSASSKITLGKNTLYIQSGTKVAEGSKVASITGSGIGKGSVLWLYDTAFTVAGNVDKVDMLCLEDAELNVQGKVNVGDVVAYTDENPDDDYNPQYGYAPTLVGTAVVTRKNNKVTKVASQIKINGEVDYTAGSFAIVLQEKNAAGEYVDINFMADEMLEVRESGIQLAQAPKAAAMMVVLSERNVGAVDTYYVAKANGNLVCLYQDDMAMILYYTQTEYYEEWDEEAQDFVLREENYDILSGCKTFTDAVTEINNLKTKRDYAIILNAASSDATLENPVQLKMPNKNYVETLYICGDAEEESYDLCYTGNITFTSDVEVRNVNFVQVAKDANGKYVSVNTLKDSYPAPVTVSTGGNNLVISGLVTFNTPIKLDGGKKGTLDIKGELTTETNNNVNVCGSITNFAVVNVETMITLSEYGTVSRGKTTYTAPVFSATTLNIAGASFLQLQSDASKATLTVTDLNMSGASLSIDGNATIKNAVFDGDARVNIWGKLALTNVTLNGTPTLGGETGFTISGTLTSNTSGATLWSHQDAKGKPVLNITGKVELTDPANKMNVCVYTQNGSRVELNGAPDATGMLLSAKTATADMFVPVSECVLDGRPAYSEENPDGYFLMKSGTGIYVYYGDQLGVALCEGYATDGDLTNADVLGYYTDFKAAVAAIDSLKDKDAVYTLVLLKDVNSADAPAALTLPGNAANVIIISKAGEDAKNLYFTGKLSLKAPTAFANVVFQPMTKSKEGTAFDIETGVHYLALLGDVAVGNMEGMALRNIKGNAKQNTTLSSDGLVVTGSITNTSGLLIGANTTVKGNIKVKQLAMVSNLTVDGSVTVDELLAQGNVTLDAQKNAVTIKNIDAYSGQPTIIYGKNAKGAPNLKITGMINSENPIILNYITDVAEGDFLIRMDAKSVKYVLNDKQKLATIEKSPLSDITFKMNGADLDPFHLPLKANKGVYLIAGDAISDCVRLSMTTYDGSEASSDSRTKRTLFLDFAQAVKEIDFIADKDAEYAICTGLYQQAGLKDTNLLDNNVFGPLTLPKANMAKRLDIISENESEIFYTGNISYSGKLTIYNVTLNPVKSVGNYVDSNITITKDKRGVAELNLINVSTYADDSWANGNAEMTGFIGQISGTKNVTSVTLNNCDLRLKKGISNVDTLILDSSKLITCGVATVNNLVLDDADPVGAVSTWDALAKTTVGNINVVSWSETEGYIASKQTAKTLVPMFTVTGDVNIEWFMNAIPVKVITADSKTNNIAYVDTYKDVSLVVATKAAADNFMAAPFADGSNDEGIAEVKAYKDTKNAVKNGDADEMKVLLSYEGGETYAKSYADAVTLINNIGDKEGIYTIEFLTTGDVTANGTSYGALTFPTKAREVMIIGQEGTVLKYTGTLKPSVGVTFANITLTEGTATKAGVFTPSYAVTLNVSNANAVIGFEEGTYTLKKDGDTETADLVVTSISGNKGGVAVFDRTVKVQKDAALATLYVSDNAVVDVLGKLTVKTINLLNISEESCMASVEADGAMTITDINGVMYEGDDVLLLGTRFTAKKKATDASVSQLTVNGAINDDVMVGITVEMYDFETKSYHTMTVEEAEALLIVDENVSSAKNQKIATMPKANVYDVAILLETEDDIIPIAMGNRDNGFDVTIVKHDGGIYMSQLPPAVCVEGFVPVYEDGEQVDLVFGYSALFLNWEQAVKEIDKIADKNAIYCAYLLRNAGQKLDGELAPLKTLTLPTKVKHFVVEGEGNHMFFTGKINVKSSTVFANVGLMAVKQVKKGKDSRYESVKYDMAIGNNFVAMDNMISNVDLFNENGEYFGYFENLPGTVSGSKKGQFEFSRSFGDDFSYSNMPATKISGIGTVVFSRGEVGEGHEDYHAFMTVPMGITGVDKLIVNPMVYLESWDGAMNVKNLESTNSFVRAKNLTVTGTTELTSGILVAGTDVVGDGTLKLANVVLHDDNSALSAKQDKKGKSLMQITGTVTASEAFYEELGEEASTEGALTVDIRYNNDVSCAQLYNGFLLLTAPKADASWFVPYYTTSVPRQAVDNDGNPIFDEETGEPVFIPILDEEGNPMYDGEGNPMYEQEELPGMGWYNPDYCTYKLGKAIYYGYGAQ